MDSAMSNLELRMAQIEEWKKCKDDAEYRAKVKAENEYWNAVERLKQYHKKIEDICVLVNKLYSYKIYTSGFNGLSFISLHPDNDYNLAYKEYFGFSVRDRFGANTDHYVIYDDGKFYHYRASATYFNSSEGRRPKTDELTYIYERFPEFEKQFYEWFDKTLKE